MGTAASSIAQRIDQRFSILIAENNTIVQSGLRALIGIRDNWKIVGFARSVTETVSKISLLHPDLMIADMGTPGLDSEETRSHIFKLAPSMRILLLADATARNSLERMLGHGIQGCLLTSDNESLVIEAVEAIQRGRSFITASVVRLQRAHAARAMPHQSSEAKQLTPREVEVVRLIAEGCSNKEVASALDISVRTAENHRAHSMRKLKLRTFSELIRYAVRMGMVDS